MSWSATPKEGLAPLGADEIVFSNFNFIGQPDVPEAEEAFLTAVDAADKLVSTGVFGNPASKRFYVNLSGHANTSHEPAEGWVNDCVTISVSQASDL